MTAQVREIIFERVRDYNQPPRIKRAKFLRMSAVAFFGLAGRVAFPSDAEANHAGSCPEGSTAPCIGRRICDCCVWGPGCTCCDGLCTPSHNDPSGNLNCPYDNACWIGCAENRTWKCCDFVQCSHQCICRLYLGDYCNW